MLEQQYQSQSAKKPRLLNHLAHDEREIQEALRLRYKVFVEEMGAKLSTAQDGMESDMYDKYCEHLIVRECDSNKVVGTYRILPPEQAKKIGAFYSQNEFDLTRLLHLGDQMVEVGRACVHWDYRNGSVITQLWSGLAQYMLQHKYEYMIGCASVSISDGGHVAASIYNKLQRNYLAPIEYQTFPRYALPLYALNSNLDVEIPALLKGYLRLGAYICGEPAWDPEFNTADFFILLPISHMKERYAKHFLKS